jgi:hypothetical protein
MVEDDYSTNSSNSSLSDEDKRLILSVMGINGSIAAIVCAIALGMLVSFKLYKYFIHRLAMYQVMAALFFALACVFETINFFYKKPNAACVISAFLLEYSTMVKLTFTLCLTFHLFFYTVFHVDFKKLEVVHVFFSACFPLLYVWVPLVHNYYGQAGAWCWITNWNNDSANHKILIGEIEEYTLLYGPAILSLSLAVIAVIVILIVLSCRAFRKSTEPDSSTFLISKDKHKKVLMEVLPLVMYPVISFIIYIPAFLNRLIGSVYNHASVASFIIGASALPALSFFAGFTLIVHVLVLKCSKLKRHQMNFSKLPTKVAVNSNILCSDHNGIPTTTAVTAWYIPSESEIDRVFD